MKKGSLQARKKALNKRFHECLSRDQNKCCVTFRYISSREGGRDFQAPQHFVRRKARERICSSLSRTLQRNNSNPGNLHFFDFFLKTHVDVQRWIIRLAGRLFFRDRGTLLTELNLKSTENGLCIRKRE